MCLRICCKKKYNPVSTDDQSDIVMVQGEISVPEYRKSVSVVSIPDNESEFYNSAHNLIVENENVPLESPSICDEIQEIMNNANNDDTRSSSSHQKYTVKNRNMDLHASLLYSLEEDTNRAYIAGKVSHMSINGQFQENSQFKVHVSLLPNKKYVIKTKWHDAELLQATIGEYFKFCFQTKPSDNKTLMRMRVYSRKRHPFNRRSFGKETCFGECYVNIDEVIRARWGLTIKRNITKILHDVNMLK